MKCYTKLTDGLYLGNQYSTSIITDIDVIISIGCKSKSTIPSVVNYKVSVQDSVDSDLTPLFGDVTEFIHIHLSNNKKVLVHCQTKK
jgi:protein-tyrosine phosphatase